VLTLPRFALAQAYPVRPITIVDTFPPGGSTGIIARIIADKFSETLGQQVIVDQRAGAGGTRLIIDRLNKELRAALATDDIRSRFATIGAEPLPSTPEEYAADIDREETKWSTLIKSLGLKPANNRGAGSARL
jgi:tripartite-type tricarboxylate transporter receptor subunit TctC